MENARFRRDRARKHLLMTLALVVLAGLSLAPLAYAQAGLWTQTLQEHFAAGTLTDVDVNSSPGDVLLALTETVDQEQLLDNDAVYAYGSLYHGQTFRPATSGALTRIRLIIQRFGNPASLIVELRNVAGGVPGTTVYASASLTPSSIIAGSYNAVNVVFATPYDVVAGTDYAFVLRQEGNGGDDENSYGFRNRVQDVYDRGDHCYSLSGDGGWVAHGYDVRFQTLVGAYAVQGELVSSRHDAGANLANWGTLTWQDTTPGTTGVRFQIATSDDPAGPWDEDDFVGPDGSAGSFYTSSGATIWGGHGTERYIRYRAVLTGDGLSSPRLHAVTLSYTLATPTPTSAPTDTATPVPGDPTPTPTETHTPTPGPSPTPTATPLPRPLDSAEYDNFQLCPLDELTPPVSPRPPLLRECASVLSNADFEPSGSLSPWVTGAGSADVYANGGYSCDRDGRRDYGFSMFFRCDRYHYWPYDALDPWAYQAFTVPAMISTTESVTIEMNVSLFYGVPPQVDPGAGPYVGTLGRPEDELAVSVTQADGTPLTTGSSPVTHGDLSASQRGRFYAYSDDLTGLFDPGDPLQDHVGESLHLRFEAPNVDNDGDGLVDGDSEFYIDQVRCEICTTVRPPAYEGGQVRRIGGYLQVMVYGNPTPMQGVSLWAIQLPDGGDPPAGGWGFYPTYSIHDSTYNFYNVNPGQYRIYAEVWVTGVLYSASTSVTVGEGDTDLMLNLMLG